VRSEILRRVQDDFVSILGVGRAVNVQTELVEAGRDAAQGVSFEDRGRRMMMMMMMIDEHVTPSSVVERDDVPTSTLVERTFVDACTGLGVVLEVGGSFAIVSINACKSTFAFHGGTTHPEQSDTCGKPGSEGDILLCRKCIGQRWR